MAIWQYRFYILPNESVESLRYSNIDDDLGGQGDFDDEFYWRLNMVDKNFFENVELILKKGKSWSKNIDLYGDQESNCFEVLFNRDTNQVLSVSFRIDFTKNYEPVLKEIIQFCLINGLLILDERLRIIPLNYEVVRNIIENSPQVKNYRRLTEG